MDKKLLATAVAASLMLPGLAAADIKISGLIQAEAGTIEVDSDSAYLESETRKMGTSGSGAINGGGDNALGISGSERLGNGMSAYFKINQSFSTFDGGSAFGARDRFVGLKGDGWHVQLGRMNIAYKTASIKYDPFKGTGLQSRGVGAVSGLHNGYGDNLIEVGIKSGEFSAAFQTTWEDSSNEDDVVTDNLDTVGTGSWNGKIQYNGDNFELGIAHASLKYGDNDDADATKLYGKLSMMNNGLMITAQYEKGKSDDDADLDRFDGAGQIYNPFLNSTFTSALGNADFHQEKYDSLHFGATYSMTDSTALIGRYAQSEVSDASTMGNDVEGDHYAIGVVHHMSKRTHVYGGYMSNSYDVKNADADTDLDAWGIGLRHKF